MKKIKQTFKTLYTNIRSWDWYEWIKYTLAALLCSVAVFMLGILLYLGISEPGFGFEILALLFGLLLVSPMLSAAWLIIKDYRLPYLFLIVFSIFCIYWSLQGLGVYHDHYPRFLDVIDYLLIAVSIVNICKISFDKKISKKHDESLLSNLSVFFVFGGILILLMGHSLSKIIPDDEDWKFERDKECIETRVAKGYPKDFARKYCLEVVTGCLEKKYSEDCDPELYCCFKTIEEDKKWNYLDYDEKGNKITK